MVDTGSLDSLSRLAVQLAEQNRRKERRCRLRIKFEKNHIYHIGPHAREPLQNAGSDIKSIGFKEMASPLRHPPGIFHALQFREIYRDVRAVSRRVGPLLFHCSPVIHLPRRPLTPAPPFWLPRTPWDGTKPPSAVFSPNPLSPAITAALTVSPGPLTAPSLPLAPTTAPCACGLIPPPLAPPAAEWSFPPSTRPTYSGFDSCPGLITQKL